MTSVYTILLLIVFGFLISPILMFLFPFSGVIGEAIGGEPSKRSKPRLVLGILVATAGQTYFYLCFLAFVISWTQYRITSDNFSKYIIWSVAFLCALMPIWIGATRFKVHHKTKNTGYANIIVEASYFTGVLAFIGFFVFAFNSELMSSLWDWVPYVGK